DLIATAAGRRRPQERRHLCRQHHLADKRLTTEPLRVEWQRIVGSHAERSRIHDEMIAGWVIVAEFDRKVRVVAAQARDETLHCIPPRVEDRERARPLGSDESVHRTDHAAFPIGRGDRQIGALKPCRKCLATISDADRFWYCDRQYL